MLLDKKTIIITGASSGIGAAAARIFAAAGANVVLGARRKSLLDHLVNNISKSKGKAVSLSGDVKDEEYSSALVQLALSSFGGLDAAFNNTGTVGELSSIPEMKTENWQDVIATNLTSAYFAAKYQVPPMIERGAGSLLFTSSFVGHTNGGLSGMGAYAASKAGLIGLTQSLAGEHGANGVRVNTLLPGGTKTAMAGDDPEAHEYIAQLHSLKRMASPDEIAKVALFLMSDHSSFITGSALMADGGISIRLVS